MLIRNRQWDRQPYCTIELEPLFNGGYIALPGSYGLFGVNGGSYYFSQLNTSTLNRQTTAGLLLIADNGGSVDDRLLTVENIPSPRALNYTTILVFDFNSSGHNDVYLQYIGHQINIVSNTLSLGYQGNNGYYYSIHYPGQSNADRIGKSYTFVVSSNINKKIVSTSVSINGKLLEKLGTTAGNSTYIGAGPLANTYQPMLGNTAYTNYYHPSGLLRMWGKFPGVFLDQNDADSIAINPWQIFKYPSQRIPAYLESDSVIVPPILSNPGMTNITSTGGTPIVRVDY